MSPTQTIWRLRKQTRKLTTKILDAIDGARREEERNPTEGMAQEIIEQNTALHQIHEWITGGTKLDQKIPKAAEPVNVVKMAHEIQAQIELHTRRRPQENEIEASYAIALTQQRQEHHQAERLEAKEQIQGTTGSTMQEIDQWIKTAQTIANI